MKKKGFTLIELLAVIVILAIIALIATPIVMNVIESSRKGAAERSYENYIRAVETAIAEERINGPIVDGTYEVMSDGSLCKGTISETNCTGTKLSVEVSGTKPAAGSTVKVENGLITKGNDTTLSIGDYTVKYDTAQNKVVATKTAGGSTTAKICTYVAEEGTTAGEIGAKYNCTVAEGVTKTFYLLEKGSTVTLIMNENFGNTTAEVSFDQISDKLEEYTSEWSVDVDVPTSEQIKSANDNSDTNLKPWLYENLGNPANGEQPPFTYWTKTPHYYVSRGTSSLMGPDESLIGWIRPVIIISAGELGE